ncbi:MAG: hypothetical protein HY718_19225 [Planctomycetes bacterium]|nr:hypothetical protein [Planctomycetota bacterium]
MRLRQNRLVRWLLVVLAGGMLYSGSGSSGISCLGRGSAAGNFNQDSDGDGYSDSAEYLAGTNPDNPNSHP